MKQRRSQHGLRRSVDGSTLLTINPELRRRVDTYDFVRMTKRDTYWQARKRDREAITDPKTGAIYEELLERTTCCICRKDNARFLLWGRGFRYVQCTTCGLLYTNPRLVEERAVKFYKGDTSYDAWTAVLTSSLQMQYDRKKFNLRLERIERYVPRGPLIDVGCSIGHFLKVAKDRGWKPYGVELNKKAVQYARATFGLRNARQQTLEEAKFPSRFFHAAGLWGVIEHVLHPDLILKELHRVLIPGGVVIISTPNAGSLAARIMHGETSCFDGMVHVSIFSESTLRKLLDKCGFEILELTTEQPEIDTAWNYLNYQDPYIHERSSRDGDVKFPLEGETRKVLEEAILRLNLGYKLIVLAQKPKKPLR